jgi:hypothetical protein
MLSNIKFIPKKQLWSSEIMKPYWLDYFARIIQDIKVFTQVCSSSFKLNYLTETQVQLNPFLKHQV